LRVDKGEEGAEEEGTDEADGIGRVARVDILASVDETSEILMGA
jgi:hypothetical protein